MGKKITIPVARQNTSAFNKPQSNGSNNRAEVQDPDRFVPDKDKILLDLTEMGYQLNRFGGYERIDEMTGAPISVSLPILTTRVIDHRQRQTKHPLPKERIQDVLVEHSQSEADRLFLKK